MQAQALVVDKAGLARKLAHKPKDFIIWELLQNALDEDVTFVNIGMAMVPNKPICTITVEDDCPEGFKELSSIYTLFKDSKKADDPTKRGRFELGEKLVIATAKTMQITTTKGSVSFVGNTRVNGRTKRDKGTEVTLTVRMTRTEFKAIEEKVKTFLMPPGGPKVTFNGEVIEQRKPLDVVTTSLQTVVSDEEGALKRVQRKTDVRVYPVKEGEVASIYEMGIPVCRSWDLWHYDVQQRVPVNWERDNVPDSYLKALRVAVVDQLRDHIPKDSASHTWVQSTLDKVSPSALDTVVHKQFGDKAVIADPSDPEGTKLAVSKGFTVVHGGSFSGAVWDNIKANETLRPAGQVTPSPKPYSDDPHAPVEKILPEEKWTDDVRRIVALTRRLGHELLDCDVEVRVSLSTNNFAACFGRGSLALLSGARMAFNYRCLGKAWFRKPNTDEGLLSLIIHEFGHYYSSDHLSEEYHDALCDLGARLARLALTKPEVFDPSV